MYIQFIVHSKFVTCENHKTFITTCLLISGSAFGKRISLVEVKVKSSQKKGDFCQPFSKQDDFWKSPMDPRTKTILAAIVAKRLCRWQ